MPDVTDKNAGEIFRELVGKLAQLSLIEFNKQLEALSADTDTASAYNFKTKLLTLGNITVVEEILTELRTAIENEDDDELHKTFYKLFESVHELTKPFNYSLEVERCFDDYSSATYI